MGWLGTPWGLWILAVQAGVLAVLSYSPVDSTPLALLFLLVALALAMLAVARSLQERRRRS